MHDLHHLVTEALSRAPQVAVQLAEQAARALQHLWERHLDLLTHDPHYPLYVLATAAGMLLLLEAPGWLAAGLLGALARRLHPEGGGGPPRYADTDW